MKRALRIVWWSLRRDLATFSRNPARRTLARKWQTPDEVKEGLEFTRRRKG